MSTNTIKVDKAELAKQIAKLEGLRDDDTLSQLADAIQENVINDSAGSTAANVKCLNGKIKGIEKQLQLLLTRTLDFFKNTRTTFIQEDRGLAKRIKNGTEK